MGGWPPVGKNPALGDAWVGRDVDSEPIGVASETKARNFAGWGLKIGG
tara:strand:+ start:342 stop:485 length:144 start_codon:yes stop_codon:yes gene_type:complete